MTAGESLTSSSSSVGLQFNSAEHLGLLVHLDILYLFCLAKRSNLLPLVLIWSYVNEITLLWQLMLIIQLILDCYGQPFNDSSQRNKTRTLSAETVNKTGRHLFLPCRQKVLSLNTA